MPCATVAATALVVRIAPSTGPMHGVQPKAKAMPITYAAIGRPPLSFGCWSALPAAKGPTRAASHHGCGRMSAVLAVALASSSSRQQPQPGFRYAAGNRSVVDVDE